MNGKLRQESNHLNRTLTRWWGGIRSIDPPTLVILVGSVAAVCYMFTCKFVLFRHLEYFGSDMYSFLQMTKSWITDGRILYDNVYGSHVAIHTYYIMLVFYPLTALLGAYGLFTGLFLAVCASTIAVARFAMVPIATRIALLAALVSPIVYLVIDHPQWGFHPELLYPFLAVIFAVALAEHRTPLAVVVGIALICVKEDGAVVIASVAFSYFVVQIFSARTDAAQRRVLCKRLVISLTACIILFIIGIVFLHVIKFVITLPAGQELFSTSRITESLNIITATLTGTGNPEWGERLRRGLLYYLLIALAFGILLQRELFFYLSVAVPASAPVFVVLMVTSGSYGFGNLFWAPRVATQLASLLGTLVVVAWSTAGDSRVSPKAASNVKWARVSAVVGVIVASWALQMLVTRSAIDYRILPRLNLPSLISGEDLRSSRLSSAELNFARCLARELPANFPVSSHGPQSPVFHRQDLSFPGIDANAVKPPLIFVTVNPEARTSPSSAGFQVVVGQLTVSGPPEYKSLVEQCALTCDQR